MLQIIPMIFFDSFSLLLFCKYFLYIRTFRRSANIVIVYACVNAVGTNRIFYSTFLIRYLVRIICWRLAYKFTFTIFSLFVRVFLSHLDMYSIMIGHLWSYCIQNNAIGLVWFGCGLSNKMQCPENCSVNVWTNALNVLLYLLVSYISFLLFIRFIGP